MKRTAAYWFPAACVGVILAGCETTGQTYDPVQPQVAQLRSDVSGSGERITALNQNLENLQERLSAIERENAALQSSVKSDQQSMRDTLATVSQNQQGLIDQRIRGALAANMRELESVDQKSGNVVKSIRAENAALQKSIAADLTTLSRDVKAMQIQLNAYLDKVDRIEQRLRLPAAPSGTSSGASSAAPSATSSAPVTPREKPQPSSMKRTVTPSSAEIDYSQVYEHSVEPGETLWKISHDYNVPVQDIFNVNPNLSETAALKPGQKLYVPSRKKQ